MAISHSVQAPRSGVWGIGITWPVPDAESQAPPGPSSQSPHCGLHRDPRIPAPSSRAAAMLGPRQPQTSDFMASWWVSRSVIPVGLAGWCNCFLSLGS